MIELRLALAAAVTARATPGVALSVGKTLSGAGDKITTLVGALKLTVSLDGVSQPLSVSDTTLYITKRVDGYSLAAAEVVNARLRKLFLVTRVALDAQADLAAVAAEYDAVEVLAELERAAGTSVAPAQVALVAQVEGIAVSSYVEQNVAVAAKLDDVELLRAA